MLAVCAFRFRMKRKHPAIVSGSPDPERIRPGFDGVSPDSEIASRLNACSFIHAYSPHASDWEFRNAVASEWRPAVVDRNLLSFDCGFSSAAVALSNCNGGKCADHCCA